MSDSNRLSWDELYIIQDLYSAWVRVLARWFYLEGVFCVPTATVWAPSEAEAAKLESAWQKLASGDSVHRFGNELVAISKESFEAEEAQCYVDTLRDFPGKDMPAMLCSVICLDPDEFPASVRKAICKAMGRPANADPDEDEDAAEGQVVSDRLTLAILRDWEQLPVSFPGGKLALKGRLVSDGMADVAITVFDGHDQRDATAVMLKALAFTRDFMAKHNIAETTPWMTDAEATWQAPSEQTANVIAEKINEFEGHAERDAATVKGRAGEIWSVVTWYMFARTARIFHEYPAKDPIVRELSGEPATGQAFSGLTVCFTGKLEAMERDQAHALE